LLGACKREAVTQFILSILSTGVKAIAGSGLMAAALEVSHRLKHSVSVTFGQHDERYEGKNRDVQRDRF
jgi:hypothetical protein